MAGVPNRSGGHNRLSLTEHLAKGTFRSDRATGYGTDRAWPPVSKAERRRVLDGLAGEPRQLAAKAMDEYHGWDRLALFALRQCALSAARIEALQAKGDTSTALDRERRMYLQFYRALGLELPR